MTTFKVGQIWVDNSMQSRTVVWCDDKQIKYKVGKSAFIFHAPLVTFMRWAAYRDWELKNKPVMKINKKVLKDI